MPVYTLSDINCDEVRPPTDRENDVSVRLGRNALAEKNVRHP